MRLNQLIQSSTKFTFNNIKMAATQNLAVCATCGTQFDFTFDERPETCRMCDVSRLETTHDSHA